MKVSPPIKVNMCLVPTCQVRVSRSYQRCCVPASACLPLGLLRFGLRLCDLNRDRQISVGTAGPQNATSARTASTASVGTAGPQPRAPDVSGHSARAKWALPDLNCESQIVGTAGPQLRVQDVT